MSPTPTPTTETCGACGADFPDISEIFSHPCPALTGRLGRGIAESPAPRPSGAGAGSAPSGPTDKQMSLLAKLASERGVEVPSVSTKAAASAAIDRLMATPRLEAAPAPVRPNRYAGRCGTCRADVAPETGRIDKVDGRWVTYHLAGACPEAAPVAPPAAATPVVEVPSGRYAFTAEEGHIAFAKVDVGKEGSRWEGMTFVRLLVGSPGNLREHRVGRPAANSILAKIAEAGPVEAMARFGHELGICGRCASPLTDPESIARGIGPVCAGKMGA